jgi:MFS family permease
VRATTAIPPWLSPAIGDGYAATVSSSLRAAFASLQVPDFRFLWLGMAFGHVGFWMQFVAQGWLAYDLTGSATFLGLVSAAGGVPGILLMLPAGVIADRFARRGLLIWTNAAMAVCALALALALWVGVLEPWLLLVIVVVNASASAVNLPARQSLGPQLVGPALVSNAIALMAVSFNVSRWLGPALAGALIVAVGTVGAFAAQVVCLMLATAFTIAVGQEPPRDPLARSRSVGRSLVDGIQYVWHEPIVRGTVVIALLHNGLGLLYAQLMPVFAGEVFHIGAGGLGALMSSVGVGATAGAIAASFLSAYPRKGVAAFVTGVGCSVAMLVFAIVPWPLVAMAALVVLGGLQVLSMTATQMILNLTTPDEYRGRAMSVYMLTWNAAPLSALPAGWIADRVGAPLTIGGSAVITLIGFLTAAMLLGGVRRFHDQPPPGEPIDVLRESQRGALARS